MLAVGLVFPVPQKIEGYATDDAFAVDANEPTEAMMGVDGKMSAGWVPTMRLQTISLQADSPSLFMFDTWATAQEVAREVFFCDGTLILPSIGKKYALTRGVLSSMKTFPDAKKTLQPVQYRITWQSIAPALV
jgi:hypothetical protein